MLLTSGDIKIALLYFQKIIKKSVNHTIWLISYLAIKNIEENPNL